MRDEGPGTRDQAGSDTYELYHQTPSKREKESIHVVGCNVKKEKNARAIAEPANAKLRPH